MAESPKSASSASIISGLDPARDTAEKRGVVTAESALDRALPALTRLMLLPAVVRAPEYGSLVRVVSMLRAAELALRSRRW